MSISPPRPKGPPLNALRAFEAAARLGGFAAAAGELCVTPGAVAQHVKTLEQWTGALLFERRSQGVRLTPLGERAMGIFGSAFDQLGEAVQALRAEAAPRHVHIAVLPSVAQLWLSPNLPAIRSAAPDVTISITALERRPNMLREPFDLCVFFDERPSDQDTIEIGQDVIFPVCAPSIAARLRSPRDLHHATCLHDSTWSDDWATWLEAALPRERVDSSGPAFSLYSLAVEEAKNGAGVLIGHELLVRTYLNSGALVAPFAHRVSLDQRLTIAVTPSATPNAAVNQIVEALTYSDGRIDTSAPQA